MMRTMVSLKRLMCRPAIGVGKETTSLKKVFGRLFACDNFVELFVVHSLESNNRMNIEYY